MSAKVPVNLVTWMRRAVPDVPRMLDNAIYDFVIERADVFDGAVPREVGRQLAAQAQSQEELAAWRAAPGTKVIFRFSTLDNPYHAMIKSHDFRRVAKRAVIDPGLGMTRNDLCKYVISLQSCTAVTYALGIALEMMVLADVPLTLTSASAGALRFVSSASVAVTAEWELNPFTLAQTGDANYGRPSRYALMNNFAMDDEGNGSAGRHMILLLRLERVEDNAPYYMYVDPTVRQVAPSKADAVNDVLFLKPLPVPEHGDEMRPPVPAPYRDVGAPLMEHEYESFEDALGWLREALGGSASDEALATFFETHVGLPSGTPEQTPETPSGAASGAASEIPEDILRRLAMIPTVVYDLDAEGTLTRTER